MLGHTDLVFGKKTTNTIAKNVIQKNGVPIVITNAINKTTV